MPKTPADASKSTITTDITQTGIDSYAPYLMNRTLRRYNARVEADVRATGLNIPRLRVLTALAAEGPQTVNNIAIYAISEQSTTSRLLDQMEAEGLIKRGQNPSDSRSRIADLTDLGRQKFVECFPLMLAAEGDMLAGFSPGERSLALEFMRRMLDNVRQSGL